MTSLKSINPATGDVVGDVTVTPVATIPSMVTKARGAQAQWYAMGLLERRKCLLRLVENIGANQAELADLVCREMGKPLKEANGEVRSCAQDLEANTEEMMRALSPEVLEDSRTRSVLHRDPFGVCAVITPWNFPFSMPHWMVIPALMAGNTVVLKPSECTPLTGQAYADLVVGVVPDNVIQVIHGADEQGRALVASDIDLIAFTGSRATGKKIMQAASSNLTRLILELGGKDPLIILDDANLVRAARFAASNSFRNAGQVCVSTERIFVGERIADRFLELLAEETKTFVVGDGHADDTRVGPMINDQQRKHVLAQVHSALENGATIAAGGAPMDGNFVSPTVLVGVSDDMEIAKNETFGPIACVSVVKDSAEAIQRANNTRFGLGAVVFGEDEDATAAVARQLHAGMIGINRSVGGVQGAPWVGARESGYGFHGSIDGHRQFAQTRVISSRR